jgi:dTMP kinase
MAQGGLKPALTLWIDVDVTTGLQRAKGRGAADRLESETRRFHEQVRRGFAAIAKAEPRRVVRVDGACEPAAVLAACWDVVGQRLRRRGYEL